MLKTIRGSLGTIVKWAAVALAILIVLKVIIFLYPSATKNGLVNFIYTGNMSSIDAAASSSDEVSEGEPWYRTFFSINPYPDFVKINANLNYASSNTESRYNIIKYEKAPSIEEYNSYGEDINYNSDWEVDASFWEVDIEGWNDNETDWNQKQTDWGSQSGTGGWR